MIDGIIVVDKPAGWTSFDVVAKIRNLAKTKKVGHSGTLDPMATGVLPIFLGKATKSIQDYLNGDKGYEGEMVLGITTDTGDAEGKIQTSNVQLPNNYQLKQIEEKIKKYRGEIEQVPPMYSAVKINGERLYKLARKGIEVKREPRKITIYSLLITHYSFPRVAFTVTCSKGTYIRQLVVDIGEDLGCGAHLSKLVRTYAHPFKLSQAVRMDTIISLAKEGKLDTIIQPIL
jgi:tRNA pseudouridine55 synthase